MNNRAGATAGSGTDERNSPQEDRRKDRRFTLRDKRGRLNWSDGGERITTELNVIDISGGGAAVLSDRAPTVGGIAYLCLQNSVSGMESLEARVVATSTAPSGKHQVRMRFTSWVSLDAILEKHQERRLWQRYPAPEVCATVIFYDNGIEQTIRGELLNISGGGAAVVTEIAAPADVPLWFEVANGDLPTVPTECKLVVISHDPSGSIVVRLGFLDSCPMEVFELAVNSSTGAANFR